ncbi:secreted frizzled-related protein 2-like [Pelodytes ibericus]
MLPHTFIFLIGLLTGSSQAFDIGLSTKCVPIPTDMGLCSDIGYSEMRLPNLMGHTNIAEVVPKSAEWQSLIQTGCHPYARTFLCSLFAPVCLDTFIQPCRSMCIAVRDSCAPVLACHGHSWPESLNCDRFPAGEDMCLATLSTEFRYMHKGLPKPTCQGCPLIEESSSTKNALEAFCENDFAVKVKLAKRKTLSGLDEYEVEGHVEFISQGQLMPYDTRHMISQWMIINENCAERIMRGTRSTVYIIAGDIHHGRVIINRILHWPKKDAQLTIAVRKWRYHKC